MTPFGPSALPRFGFGCVGVVVVVVEVVVDVDVEELVVVEIDVVVPSGTPPESGAHAANATTMRPAATTRVIRARTPCSATILSPYAACGATLRCRPAGRQQSAGSEQGCRRSATTRHRSNPNGPTPGATPHGLPDRPTATTPRARASGAHRDSRWSGPGQRSGGRFRPGGSGAGNDVREACPRLPRDKPIARTSHGRHMPGPYDSARHQAKRYAASGSRSSPRSLIVRPRASATSQMRPRLAAR